MSTIVKMPQLGESVVEGTVARWLKGAGDRVAKNEALLEISTDKIDTEVPAPADGVLLEIRVAAGATVKAGAVLAMIGSEAEYAAAPAPDATGSVELRPSAAEVDAQNGVFVADGTKGEPTAARTSAPTLPQGDERPGGRSFVSPVVARMAAEHNLDLAQIKGTGLGGA